MRKFHGLKTAAVTVTGLAVIFTASPAAAGRCGHSYPVDKPTTLGEVARQCNVRLSELREANPGVTPGNVRPGEHLAVPDERDQYSTARPATLASDQTAASSGPTTSHPFIVSPDYNAPATDVVADDQGMNEITLVQDFRGDNARAAQRIRVRDTRIGSDAPVWLQREAPTGGHYSAADRASYQKLSALRIRNAGFRTTSATTANTKGVLAARFTKESAITVITTHPGYRLPDYSAIGNLNHKGIQNAAFSLSGEVIDADQGCLVLKTKNDQLWRLAAAPPSGGLLGKSVTVWGTQTASTACGAGPSMLVSHAVYAEPWPPKK